MNSKVRFLSGNEIWSHIECKLKENKPSVIAVPFVGLDSHKWIKLVEGSLLLTRCDIGSARAGQVSGKDLLAWYRKGVKIFNLKALHAKVFVFDGAAFIGSSNASKTSKDRLVEAGVWVTENVIVKSAKDFVEKNCIEEVDEEFLEVLAAAYRPPSTFPMHGEVNSDDNLLKIKRPNERYKDEVPMHLVSVYSDVYNSVQESAFKLAESEGLGLVKNKRKTEISSFIYEGEADFYGVGDLVLIRSAGDGPGGDLIKPWARVVRLRKVRGRQEYIVVLARFKSWECLGIEDFKVSVNLPFKGFLSNARKGRLATTEERAAVLGVWSN